MPYYRLIDKEHKENPLGYGSLPNRKYPSGRWNSRNYPAIYCSNRLSLAQLEILSIKGQLVKKQNWLVISFEIDEHLIRSLDIRDLPANWHDISFNHSTQSLGDYFLEQKNILALAVPSVRTSLSIFPEEHNLIINPFFPDFKKHIKKVKIEDFDFLLGRNVN